MFRSKHNNRLKDLEKQIDELRHEIDYLYNLLQSEVSEPPKDKDDGSKDLETVDIPSDIYDEIYKYCENKKFIFMGVA